MRALLWLVTAMSICAAGTAAAQGLGDAIAGRDLARSVCAECHLVEVTAPADALSPNPDAPSFRTIAEVPGMTAIAIRVILRTPHRQMPDIVLTPEEIRDVAAYILALKEG